MKRIVALAVGFLLAIPFGVLALSGGGFPSRPTFQALSVSPGQVSLASPSTADQIKFSTSGVARAFMAVDSGGAGIFSGAAETGHGVYVSSTGTFADGQPFFASVTTTQTGTIVGCTTSPTVSVITVKQGNVVTGYVNAAGFTSCTSNTAALTVTGALANAPAQSQIAGVTEIQNNSTNSIGCLHVTAGTTTLTYDVLCTSGFTPTGTKGILNGAFSYLLN